MHRSGFAAPLQRQQTAAGSEKAVKPMLSKLRKNLKWLDPFTYVDLFVMPRLNPKDNEYLGWAIYIFFAFVFALAFYTLLGLALNTNSPLMIVVSASMEPVLYRGDVVLLQGVPPQSLNAPLVELDAQTLRNTALIDFAQIGYELGDDGVLRSKILDFGNGKKTEITTNGDIVVYFSELRNEPIIHRAVAKLHAKDGYYIITKGDNYTKNTTVDQDCGKVFSGMPSKPCINLYPQPAEKLDGRMILKIPFLGCAKLWLMDDLATLLTQGKLPANFGGVC
ncbi:MAG: hypothetical protein V1676_01895 [Candidatus Diapherotrites archaeon]